MFDDVFGPLHCCHVNDTWDSGCLSNAESLEVDGARHAPFLVPFEERARVFQTVISGDRAERREMGIYGPQSFSMIHRSSVFQACQVLFERCPRIGRFTGCVPTPIKVM